MNKLSNLFIFLLLLLIIPTFAQNIPKDRQILKISYDKPKGTKIEKEEKKRTKEKSYPPWKGRFAKPMYLGMGWGIHSISQESYLNNLQTDSWKFSIRKGLSPNWHTSFDFSLFDIPLQTGNSQEIIAHKFRTIDFNAYYRYFAPTLTCTYRRKDSPYLMAGIGSIYINSQNLNPKLNLGLGFEWSPKHGRWWHKNFIDFEYKINYFMHNNKSIFLHQIQITFYQAFLIKIGRGSHSFLFF